TLRTPSLNETVPWNPGNAVGSTANGPARAPLVRSPATPMAAMPERRVILLFSSPFLAARAGMEDPRVRARELGGRIPNRAGSESRIYAFAAGRERGQEPPVRWDHLVSNVGGPTYGRARSVQEPYFPV